MSESASGSSAGVDTRTVIGRRALRFESIDEMMADVDRLVEAERAGRLRRLGNWTLGQALGHLATWAEYSYAGAPIKAPFFIRWLKRLQKRSFLYGPMRAGIWIPGVQGGTLAAGPMPLDEGLDRMQRVMQRLKSDPPTAASPLLGLLTHEEWIALHLRHAELHLGFQIAE